MRKITKRAFYKPLITSMLLLASVGSYAQYCVPVSTYGCGSQDDINSFSLTGENSTNITDLNTGCSTNAYVDNTALPAVNLGKGTSYSASISSEYSGDYAAIWIDFNNNNTFESTELVGFLDADVSTLSSAININIPASAPLGNHRMRVLVYYPGDAELTSADVDPCNSGAAIYEFGETQDYTVNVVVPPACPAPLVVASSNITPNGAIITWTGTGNYIVEYGPAGFTPGTGAIAGGGTIIASATSPLTISTLTPLTTYDFYVRHDCSATSEGYSSNASLLGVTTLAVPPSNDLCSNATILTSGVACNPISGTTVNTTSSGDMANCQFSGNFGDVWYSFVATHTEHDLTIGNIMSTNAAQYDSYFGMALYSGTCGSLGTEIGCLNGELYDMDSTNFSSHISGLTVGQTYFLRLWKDAIYDVNYTEISGNLTFNICLVDPPPPPVNDACANATSIPISTSSQTQAVIATLLGATTEAGSTPSSCSGAALTDDVWFTVTVPASGNVVIRPSVVVDNVASDLVMQVYSGSCNALTEIACNDDGTSSSPNQYEPEIGLKNQTPGTVLYVRVMPYSNIDKGQFSIAAWDSILPTSTPTPIVLKSINAHNAGAFNLVNWSTGGEDPGDYFELQRSADGKQFARLNKITGKGIASDYEYTDDNPVAGINYYRLKYIGINGKTAYSKVVSASLGGNKGLSLDVFPNPTHKYVTVKVSGTQNGDLMLTDISGRIIRREKMNGSEINLDMQSLSNGFYIIHYVDDNLNKVVKINKQ
jgi:hypothetical protein